MSDLTISIRKLRALVDPVIPFAGTDDMLPTLNAVRIESRGSHLVAFATDRFRLACQRIPAEEGGSWPEWSATIPLRTLRGIFQLYKAQRYSEPQITLSVSGHTVRVHGDDALLDMLDAAVTYPLVEQDFPEVGGLIAKTIANTDRASEIAFNHRFLADFAKTTKAPSLAVRICSANKPAIFADGEDFIGILMPRRRLDGGSEQTFPTLDDWTSLLEPKATPKKRVAKKATSKRGAA